MCDILIGFDVDGRKVGEPSIHSELSPVNRVVGFNFLPNLTEDKLVNTFTVSAPTLVPFPKGFLHYSLFGFRATIVTVVKWSC